jgi:hypothetical protein
MNNGVSLTRQWPVVHAALMALALSACGPSNGPLPACLAPSLVGSSVDEMKECSSSFCAITGDPAEAATFWYCATGCGAPCADGASVAVSVIDGVVTDVSGGVGHLAQHVERPPSECLSGCPPAAPDPQAVVATVTNTTASGIGATIQVTVAGGPRPPCSATFAPGTSAPEQITTAEPGQRVAVRVTVPASNQYAETELTIGYGALRCAVTLGEAWGVPMASVSCIPD